MKDGEVELLVDVDTLVYEDGLDEEAVGRGLVSDEVVADHLSREVLYLLRSLAYLNTAF